jgi:hypothetical protein
MTSELYPEDWGVKFFRNFATQLTKLRGIAKQHPMLTLTALKTSDLVQ